MEERQQARVVADAEAGAGVARQRGGGRRQPPDPATAVAAAAVEAGMSDVAFGEVIRHCFRHPILALTKLGFRQQASRSVWPGGRSWRGARCSVRSPAWSYARCTVAKADGSLPGLGTGRRELSRCGHGRSSVRTSSEEVGWCGRERIRSSSDRRNRGRKGWGWTEGGLCATWLSSEGRPAAGVQREADWLQISTHCCL
uniref:Uncharacterized protein n=1 Tax=Oryza nivara TaxID=4536 RepID=A0A0E0GZB7_ORYNI